MAASFPSSVKTWTPVADDTDEVLAAHMNDIYEEVLAIEDDIIDNTGWRPANETWTYASASTFTVAANVTSKYQKGDKIKWTQSSVKYGVIVGATYSSPNTTVTILVNSDYTIGDAEISENYFSRYNNPLAFPSYFNCTLAITSEGGTPTTTSNTPKVRIDGRVVFLYGSLSITDKGTAAGYILMDSPVQSSGYFIGGCLEVAVVGVSGITKASDSGGYLGTKIALRKHDGTTFWTSGYTLVYSVQYVF